MTEIDEGEQIYPEPLCGQGTGLARRWGEIYLCDLSVAKSGECPHSSCETQALGIVYKEYSPDMFGYEKRVCRLVTERVNPSRPPIIL
jgi:hypothetical protein